MTEILTGARSILNQTSTFEMLSGKTHIPTETATEVNSNAQREYRLQLSENAAVAFNNEFQESDETPVIRTPQKGLNNSAQALLIMAELAKNISESNIDQLTNRLAILNAQNNAKTKSANELSAELDKIGEELDVAKEEYEVLKSQTGNAEKSLDTAKSQYETAKKQLENLLQKYDESSPEVKDAQNALVRAEQELQKAQTKFDAALGMQKVKLEELTKLTSTLNEKLDIVQNKYGDLISNNINSKTLSEYQQSALTKTGQMVLILSEFISQMSENASEKLTNDMAMFRVQSDARQKEMTRKSDEYKEQVRKAEEAQKMAGCIGKILGGLAMAFGAITSIFGGAGIGVMAVGLALMAADTVMEKLTGQSLTGMLLNPIMEKVLMPIMKFLGDIVGKLLENSPLGLLLNALDKATGMNITDMVKGIATVAITIAVVMALAYVAKSAGKMLMKKLSGTIANAVMQSIKKTILDIVRKIIPKILNNTTRQAKSLLSQINKALDKIVSDPRVMNAVKWSNRAQLATDTINSGVQFVSNINISEFELKAAKAMNDFNAAKVDLSILQEGLQKAMNEYKGVSKISDDINSMLSTALQNKQQTNHLIANNMTY